MIRPGGIDRETLANRPFSVQLLGRKTRSAGQEKLETGNLPDHSGSTPKTKLASLKLETLHEIGGQLA